MPRALRSRPFAFLTLACFALAQPVVACAALCLFEGHGAVAHAMPGMSGGNPALAGSTCHTTSAGAVQHDPLQALSPMTPSRAAVLAVAPTRWVEPAQDLPAGPRLVSHTVEPPPPRFV
ncbi:MAG: hypothetical protein M3O78_06460 [Chloroflexota bacterium]|nr:hypothetical protein [Chloroflexota bacterium]